MATDNDPLLDLRAAFARIAEQLTPDIEPAVIYSLHAADFEEE